MTHLICTIVGLPVAFAAGFLLASVLHTGKTSDDQEPTP